MAIKVDGTNSQILFLAGTGNQTTLRAAPTSTLWTLTLPPNPGTAGEVLTTDGAGNLSWGPGGGGGVTTTISDDTTTNATRYPLFANATSGNLTTAFVASTEYTFNPSSGMLSAPHVASTAGLHLNGNDITTPYTIPAGMNALSAGPMTVTSFANVTVPPGQAWVVV